MHICSMRVSFQNFVSTNALCLSLCFFQPSRYCNISVLWELQVYWRLPCGIKLLNTAVWRVLILITALFTNKPCQSDPAIHLLWPPCRLLWSILSQFWTWHCVLLICINGELHCWTKCYCGQLQMMYLESCPLTSDQTCQRWPSRLTQLHSADDNVITWVKPGTQYPCTRPVFTGVRNVDREHGCLCTLPVVHGLWTGVVYTGL